MMISFEDFKKIDLKVGKVVRAERISGTQKLLKLQVNLGKETRQIVAGIGQFYEPEKLTGREIIVVANLEPKTLMGVESQGMLLTADNEGVPVLLMPDTEVKPGSKVE